MLEETPAIHKWNPCGEIIVSLPFCKEMVQSCRQLEKVDQVGMTSNGLQHRETLTQKTS